MASKLLGRSSDAGRPLLFGSQLLCTGQTPNSHHLIPSFPNSVNPSNRKIHVLPTTQIATGPGLTAAIEDGRWFAAGDCCETEAIQAGYSPFPSSPSLALPIGR